MDFGYEGEELFTLKKVAQVSGLSRTTLIRLEQAGFITPHHVNEQTGYRYYNTHNVMRVQQYLVLRELGIRQRDIFGYYDGTLGSDEFLATLHSRARTLAGIIEEFETRRISGVTFSVLEYPEVTCYCVPCTIRRVQDRGCLAYDTMMSVIAQGFSPADGLRPFSVLPADEPYDLFRDEERFHCDLCLPVKPGHIPSYEHVRQLPRQRVFALTYRGNDIAETDALPERLWQEMESRGLTPEGPLSIRSLVGPYSGDEISEADYVFRYAFPIGDQEA